MTVDIWTIWFKSSRLKSSDHYSCWNLVYSQHSSRFIQVSRLPSTQTLLRRMIGRRLKAPTVGWALELESGIFLQINWRSERRIRTCGNYWNRSASWWLAISSSLISWCLSETGLTMGWSGTGASTSELLWLPSKTCCIHMLVIFFVLLC